MAEITDYLKELSEQNVLEKSEIKIVRNSVVDELCDDFESFLKRSYKGVVDVGKDYEAAAKVFRRPNYDSKDITKFSFTLDEYKDKLNFYGNRGVFFSTDLGVFLSALINKSMQKEVTIVTHHLSYLLSYLGYINEKNLTIIGNVGDHFGAEMICGKIVVKGNAENFTGDYAKKGIIIVDGCVQNFTGRGSGGVIFVKKNAGYFTGTILNGGMIIVEGDSGDNVGNGLNEGFVIIKGNAGNSTGDSMIDGQIVVRGDVGRGTGRKSSGGEIIVSGKIKGYSRRNCGCKIYHGEKQLR